MPTELTEARKWAFTVLAPRMAPEALAKGLVFILPDVELLAQWLINGLAALPAPDAPPAPTPGETFTITSAS